MKSNEMTLKFPLKLGENKTIDKLVFREYATAGDLLAFDEIGPNKQTIHLIANLTGQAPELIQRLHVKDYRVADAITVRLINEDSDAKNGNESSQPAP